MSDPFQPGLDREIGDTYTVVIQAVIEDIEATTTVRVISIKESGLFYMYTEGRPHSKCNGGRAECALFRGELI